MNVTTANLRHWIEGTEKGDMDAEDKLIDWSLYRKDKYSIDMFRAYSKPSPRYRMIPLPQIMGERETSGSARARFGLMHWLVFKLLVDEYRDENSSNSSLLRGCCLFFFRASGVLAKPRLVEPIVKPEYVGLYLWEIMGSTTMPVPYPTKNEN
jgi:hypothetical protein